MKKILLSFALAVGLLASASTLQAQVNMSRYITLTVKNGSAIKLNFMAATNGTPVRIVSGSNTRDTTVGIFLYWLCLLHRRRHHYDRLRRYNRFRMLQQQCKPHRHRPVAQYGVVQVILFLQSAHFTRPVAQYAVGGVRLFTQ